MSTSRRRARAGQGIVGRRVRWRSHDWTVAGVEPMRVFGLHLTLRNGRGKYALAPRWEVTFIKGVYP